MLGRGQVDGYNDANTQLGLVLFSPNGKDEFSGILISSLKTS